MRVWGAGVHAFYFLMTASFVAVIFAPVDSSLRENCGAAVLTGLVALVFGLVADTFHEQAETLLAADLWNDPQKQKVIKLNIGSSKATWWNVLPQLQRHPNESVSFSAPTQTVISDLRSRSAIVERRSACINPSNAVLWHKNIDGLCSCFGGCVPFSNLRR